MGFLIARVTTQRKTHAGQCTSGCHPHDSVPRESTLHITDLKLFCGTGRTVLSIDKTYNLVDFLGDTHCVYGSVSSQTVDKTISLNFWTDLHSHLVARKDIFIIYARHCRKRN